MNNVAAVIVSYNNSAMLQGLLGDIASQNRPPDRIIVVDNASSDGTQEAIKTQFPDIDYIRMPENTGSAGGYHHGMKAALEKSQYIWTLDDDVRLYPDTLEELLKGFESLKRCCKLGAVRSAGATHPEDHPTRLHIISWRGALFSTEAVSEVSLPLPEYFLYGEDLDFSLRLARKGYHCFWIPTSHCVENRNKGKIETRLFSHVNKIYSSPFRLYYAFRNQTAIYLKFGAFVSFCRTLLYGLKVISFCLIARCEGKSERIRAILMGISDGLGGRLGKNPLYDPEKELEVPDWKIT
jgi:rhamnopyranosyl-N-acetylglucosaminyl-diphospho-decaprenol beta-1,3/1,4-galactofuranosyltransferase